MSIRIKLLLLSLVMLSIPYVGFQYLRETERYLQSSLEESLGAVASAMSISMQFQSTIFTNSVDELSSHGGLFVHSLGFPIQVDGYEDEWLNYSGWSEKFAVTSSDADNRSAYSPSLKGFKLVLGEHDQYLYALLAVEDETVNYADPARPFGPGDAVEVVYQDTSLGMNSLLLKPVAPGPVTAYKVVENWDYTRSRKTVTNVIGAWQEKADGYVVEVRIPLFMVSSLLGFVVHDDVGRAVDNFGDSETRSMFIAGTNGNNTRIRPNRLLRNSAQLKQMIERVGLKQGQRVWVLNRNGQVLATGGSLLNERKQGAINFLYTWILPRPSDTFEDDLHRASRLQGSEVVSALQGKAASRWRSSPDERAVIVSAAHPVRAGNELVGAVVIEETTNSIQTLQRDAMASLYNKSILVIVVATGVIMLFASRLSYRILRLRNTAESAIDEQGRIVGAIPESGAQDEIGDLSRSFTAMTKRLQEYHDYLESMASKLSHEIRTPISVVSSSLDNLEEFGLDEEKSRYLNRVREGVDRLQSLVSRLSESARLEQAISQAEKVELDLYGLLRELASSYNDSYKEHHIVFDSALEHGVVSGSAELIAQMMDKLIENAIQFSRDGDAPITIRLENGESEYRISVQNAGQLLPSEMQKQIFNSMVSIRSKRENESVHLGLGLYIVRLIAEYHGGQVVAENLADKSGVRVTVGVSRA